MKPNPVAVIDIGSNSIKLLVAERNASGGLDCLEMRSIDARISAGIGGARPALGEEGMQRGIAAINDLLASAVPHAPGKIVLVATSAVREAANGAAFRARIRSETGHEVRILSGDEEASLIGRGLTSDPVLADLHDFQVFDLGGGSLECLAYRDRKLAQAISVPLGCVRLMEKFAPNREESLEASAISEIGAHVWETLKASPFVFSPGAVSIGTGGTLSTVRFIEAARAGVAFEATSPTISVFRLRELLAELAVLPLEPRKKIPGLPPARADVFPTALATVIALADLGRFNAYRNSLRNLRWGVAAEALGGGVV